MKKIMFLLFVIFILFFFFSCPSEIVKKTYWNGTLDSELEYPDLFKDSHDIEIYIRNDNTIRIVVIVYLEDGNIFGDDSWEYSFDGNYTLDDNNYSFTADAEDEEGDVKIEMDGILNTTTGEGSGDFEWEWADGVKGDGDWEVTKVY